MDDILSEVPLLTHQGQPNNALNLSQYIHSLQHGGPDGVATEVSDVGGDIEGDIRKEIESMKASSTNHSKPYTFVRLEISCGMSCRALSLSFSLAKPPQRTD